LLGFQQSLDRHIKTVSHPSHPQRKFYNIKLNGLGWGKAGVAMVMIFIFFFGATFNASPYAYAAEVLPTKIRANGMAIALFSANGLTVMFTQTAPLALEKITWKFSFIFVGCNLFFFPIVYLFFPEVFLPYPCFSHAVTNLW
jgi:hypothetical protein